jgi:hypothetical protein
VDDPADPGTDPFALAAAIVGVALDVEGGIADPPKTVGKEAEDDEDEKDSSSALGNDPERARRIFGSPRAEHEEADHEVE